MLDGVNHSLDAYRFSEAANLIYAFLWHEFCDWYLEIAKNNLSQTPTQLIMYKVLEKTLRVLHPFMPFITEEIWQRINPEAGSIVIAAWPHLQEAMIDKKLEFQAELLFDIIKSIRNLRSQIELKSNQKVAVSLYPHTKIRQQLINGNTDLITNLAKLGSLEILGSSKRPKAVLKRSLST